MHPLDGDDDLFVRHFIPQVLNNAMERLGRRPRCNEAHLGSLGPEVDYRVPNTRHRLQGFFNPARAARTVHPADRKIDRHFLEPFFGHHLLGSHGG